MTHNNYYETQHDAVALLKISRARWRPATYTRLPITIEDLDGEDALDRECVPFDEVAPELAYQEWYEDRIEFGEFEDYEEEEQGWDD